MVRLLTAVLLSALVACTKNPEGVSFSGQVLPVLKRHCIICHMKDDPQGGLSLHPMTYVSLVGMPSSQSAMVLIEPGAVERSYLYHKLLNTQLSIGGEGARMPYQRDALAPVDLEMVRRWISEGAQHN